MPEPQAEILAEEQARKVCEQLTTRHDVTLLRSDLDRLKDQLTVRLGVMLAAAITIVAASLELL